jgi:Protein of unknown function (DUF2818)
MNTFFWLSAWLAASLPWRSDGVLGIIGHWSGFKIAKPLWLTLLESLSLYSLVFGIMFAIEAQRGERAMQAWQFWTIALCLWVVLSFPAAAWFKLRKQSSLSNQSKQLNHSK